MSILRGSTNYVWCTTSVLGKGATGAVFQGVNKHTGEPVAVKVFNHVSQMRPPKVQMREFEVLKKVNHENIVKLLAIEEEQENHGKVIVMELCTGGSLFTILDDPENSHGLEEKEFLLVLKHLAAGMKHLRDNNLVHRDLKPGNIMKYINVDGSTVYKLTDFGAARELEDDQQFMSLYGTEEYLHPDMYEGAVLRKAGGKAFGACVDLWSIGVTLYHVATGQLPFRPYGGRKNTETMYHITTEKMPGVISGVQITENGPIHWNTNLPDTCQLSIGLRKLVTRLLGGLLDVDPKRMWSFETFFNEVTSLLSRKVVHVFFLNRILPFSVYMKPEHKYEELKYLICEQTDVSPVNQLLLYDNKSFLDVVHVDTCANQYPETASQMPVVLLNKQDDDVHLVLPESSTKTKGEFPSFQNSINVDSDASVGKSICSVSYAVLRKINHCAKCVFLVEYSVFMLIQVMIENLKVLVKQMNHLQSLTTAICGRFGQLVANHRRFMMLTQIVGCNQDQSTQQFMEKLEDLVNNKVDQEKAVRESLGNIIPVVTQLHEKVVIGNQLRKEWLPAGQDVKAVETAPNKATTYVTKIRESWQHLLRDRVARTLTSNDDQFHQLEKMKMKETAKSKEALLASVIAVLHHTADNLADWCKKASVHRVQAEIEAADILRHETILNSFQDDLSETEETYHQTLSGFLATIKDQHLQENPTLLKEGKLVVTKANSLCNRDSNKEREKLLSCKRFLVDLNKSQDLVLKLLEENGGLIRNLESQSESSYLSSPLPMKQ